MNLEGKGQNAFLWTLTGATVAGFLGYAIVRGQLRGIEMVIVTVSLGMVVGLLALADLGFFGTPKEAGSAGLSLSAEPGEAATGRSGISSASQPAAPTARTTFGTSPYLRSVRKGKKKRR